jgi:hypothetical protein
MWERGASVMIACGREGNGKEGESGVAARAIGERRVFSLKP